MNQKKRHNPEITAEDLATKAFDRNNDAQSRIDFPLTLDQAVDTSSVEVVKSDEAKLDEFYNLVVKVFGKSLYFTRDNRASDDVAVPIRNLTQDKLEFKTHVSSFARAFTLFYSKREKWYKKPVDLWYATLEVDVPARSVGDDSADKSRDHTFFEKGSFLPIKITAHIPESLRQAKTFAAHYQKLTGQKATVIQNCVVEEVFEKVEKLEEKVEPKEPSSKDVWKQVMKDAVMGSKSAAKGPVKDFGEYFVKGGLSFFVLPTASRRASENDWANTDLNGNIPRTAGVVVGVSAAFLGLFFKTMNGAGGVGEINGDYLLFPLATNLVSLGYEGVRVVYNNAKQKLVKR